MSSDGATTIVMRCDVLKRFWRCAPWSANPLMRRSDRVYGVAVIMAVVCWMSLVPIAGAVGTVYYAAAVERSSLDVANSHRIDAVLTEDSRRDADRVGRAVTSSATWTFAGVVHRGEVTAGDDSKPGDRVTIWVSAAGDMVSAPKTGAEAVIEAAAIAIGTCWAGAILLTIGVRVARCSADRHNSRSVDSEWDALSST